MNLLDLVRREPVPEPWAEGEKIPWHEPAFSRRMLREHLRQDHDAASRRFAIVDRQVAWIHELVLGGRPARVLDLGCGPGLYTSRLARLGHACVGIDFSPAAIEHARAEAMGAGLRCGYVEADIRLAEYGTGFDLVMLLYGELNAFRPDDARLILRQANRALAGGGRLLLEPHTAAAVRRLGQPPARWAAREHGLFSDRPHLVLTESFWHPVLAAVTQRHYIVDAATAAVTRHAQSLQAYTRRQYAALLRRCGFAEVTFHPALGPDAPQSGFLAVTARK